MDAATLQGRIYSGYAKAAQRIGYTFDVFRPGAPLYSPPTSRYPLSPLNKVASLPASFTPANDKFKYDKASDYKNALWNGLFDGSKTQAGDYLVNTTHGTFFIAAMQDQLPTLCVACNRTVTVLQPSQETGVGVQPYGGTTAAGETPLMTGWPVSLLYTARGRAHEVALPLDLPAPFYMLLMPAFPGVELRNTLIIKDDLDQRYIIAAAEKTDLGWRMLVQIAVT